MPSPSGSIQSKALLLMLAEDAWMGDAYAIMRVDDAIVFQGFVTAPDSGLGQPIDLGSFDAAVAHQISVEFTNDAYGGSADRDRNLFVKDVLIDGQSTGMGAEQHSKGTSYFHVDAAVAPTATVVGSGPDTVSFFVTEDAWEGDAQFVLTVDGVQIGNVQTATVCRNAGFSQEFQLRTTLGADRHQVGIMFINDAYGGSAERDRNLQVTSLSVNGVDQNGSAALYSAGSVVFGVGAAASVTYGQGSQTIHVQASEDAWQGDAQMVVTVDGHQVGSPFTVAADHASGQVQDFYIKSDFGTGQHDVNVSFINDAWGGSTATDRNLFVQSVSLDDQTVDGSTHGLYGNGGFDVTGSFATPMSMDPTPTLVSTDPAPTPVSADPAPTPISTDSAPTPVSTGPSPTPVSTDSSPTLTQVGANSDVGLVPVVAPTLAAGTHVLTVGADKQFQTVADAINASHDGDAILVDSGTYTNDFATINDKISLYAVGGRVTMNATVPPPNLKAILTTETDTTISGFDFTGTHIPDEDGHNGAGIRQEGGNLVLENDYFSHNQNGILSGAFKGTITIDHSMFDHNGGDDPNGYGNIHNVYIGDETAATVTNSIFENAQVGHEFKSRAETNTIKNNVFISGVGDGSGSYDIDLPNGGKADVENNTIIKGTHTQNSNMLHYGGESIPYGGSFLTIANNVFDNEAGDNVTAVLNQTAITAKINGNKFKNLSSDHIVQGPAKVSGNTDGNGNPTRDQTLTGVLPGSTLVYTDASDYTVTLDGSNAYQAVQGGAGKLTVDVAKGHIIVIGGAGGMVLREEPGTTGGNQYTTVAGSTNVLTLTGGGTSIDSEGNDTIAQGDYNQAGVINGTASLTQGAGTGTWIINGTANYATGSGSSFLSVADGANLSITGIGQFYHVDTNGGHVDWNTTTGGVPVAGSIDGGAVSMQVYDGAMHMSTAGGGEGAVIHLALGDASIASGAADTIYAGSGNNTVRVTGGQKVYAGTGTLQVYAVGPSSNVDIYGNGQSVYLGGDTGNLTYHAGNQDSTVTADVSHTTLIGGAGRMTVVDGAGSRIIGGSGGITMQGSSGGAVITTAAGSSSLIKADFDDTVYSYGDDTIVHGDGNEHIEAHGASTLFLNGGGNNVLLAGNDMVKAIGSNNVYSITSGAVADITADQIGTVNATDATVTVRDLNASGNIVGSLAVSRSDMTGGAWFGSLGMDVGLNGTRADVQAKGSVRVVSHGGGDTVTFAGGGGSSSVDQEGSSMSVVAGDGSLTLTSTNIWGNHTVNVVGGSGSINFSMNGGADLKFVAGSGNSTISNAGKADIMAGSGDMNISQVDYLTFHGSTGTAEINLTPNGSLVDFGSGTSLVNEASYGHANTFLFDAGIGGHDILQGFRVGTDLAHLGDGVSVVSSDLSGAGGSAHFVLSNGADVTFAGLTITRGVFV